MKWLLALKPRLLLNSYFNLFLFLFPTFLLAQKEANNWYFGSYAGITFKNGTPTSLANPVLSTWEGVASISDSSGNILFYTDGTYVYNKKNAIMPNGSGLFGNSSSSQSAIIVKKPGSLSLYYIFTVDCVENFPGKGLNYSIVDMSLNSGLGDVSTKNILLRSSVIERLTVVRHKNNHDFWILINDWVDDDIYAYLVSCNGINTVPVKSKVGPFHNHTGIYTPGYLKASRQNNKLAMAITYNNVISVLDFDNNSGIASNQKNLAGTSTTFGGPYGLEFSPNDSLLYATTIISPKLLQFNLNAGSAANIYNNRTLLATHATIYTFNNYYYGALQIGPDGKIYSANNGDYSLGVINSPDSAGKSCNYVNNVVSLNGKQCLLGLPNFLQDYAYPIPKDTVYASICKNTFYTLPDGSKTDSAGVYVTHLFNSTICDSIVVTKIAVNAAIVTNLSPTICQGNSYQLPSGKIVTNAGIYKDTLRAIAGCDSIVITTLVLKPSAFATINQSICQGQTFLGYNASGKYVDTLIAANGCDSIRTLNLTVKSKSFSIITKSICQGQTYLGHNASGVYIDTLIAANGCDSVRTLNLTVQSKIFFTVNQSICQGQAFLGYNKSGTYIDTLAATNGCDSVRTLNLTVVAKSFSIINKSICQGQMFLGHTTSGIYIDTLLAASGCDSIRTLNLVVNARSFFTLNKTICDGDSFLGHSTTGIYVDTLNAANGCDSIRTLSLIVATKPSPILNADKTFCDSDTLILYPGKFDSYLWQDNSTQNQLIIKQAGNYSVTVTNICGTGQASIIIKNSNCDIKFPSAFTPNKDGKNDVFRALNAHTINNYHLRIYNRFGKMIFETYDILKGWDGTFNGVLQGSGTYVWTCNYLNSNSKIDNNLGGTFVLIR